MRIVLASQSPSRASILRSAGVEPVLRPADVDEETIQAELAGHPPAEIVAALANAKAEAVAPDVAGATEGDGDTVIIGGDSMLLLDGELQGKPHTVDNTIARWRAQAGKQAELLTGHCVIYGDQRHVETTRTVLRFAPISEVDIAKYARSGEPLQCAGAFTLEALGGWFIDRIEGDPSSVIGLSLPVVRRALYSFGFNASDFWENS